jgi:alkanesulfonate monooxygenase SsuD/methylene tetrahydromethanopterin reductase-like flavin-dependent oxidoreductase (luciferase family)
MTDYGHPITFGLSLIPSVELLEETRQLAQAADAAGLDYLAIQDHAYNIEWLGSQGPQMLALTGRQSDGWVSPLSTYTPPFAVPGMQRRIDEAARDAGRQPADVRRIYNVVGTVGARGGPGLTGDLDTWVATLTDWAVDLGLDTFIYWPTTAPAAQLEVFVGEVVPAVRQAVSARRSQQ